MSVRVRLPPASDTLSEKQSAQQSPTGMDHSPCALPSGYGKKRLRHAVQPLQVKKIRRVARCRLNFDKHLSVARSGDRLDDDVETLDGLNEIDAVSIKLHGTHAFWNPFNAVR